MMTEQAKDKYTWCAVYHNDESLCEEEATQGFASVKQEQVKMLLLLPLTEAHSPHYVSIPPGTQPVFFRRRSIELNLQDGQEISRPTTTHCIGCKQDERAVYLFVRDDGSTLLTSDLHAV